MPKTVRGSKAFEKRFAKQFSIAVKRAGYADDLGMLAGLAGCERRNIERYMAGTERPRIERLYRLADVLGVSTDFFNAN